MVQKDLRTEIAKEVYLKLVLEGKESRQVENFVDAAKMAIDAADAFIQVCNATHPNKPIPWFKATNGELSK